MIFNTHDRTPRIQTNKKLKIMLIFSWSLIGAFFLFFAIVASVISHSILPALMILAVMAFFAAVAIPPTVDMRRAYVQIDKDRITVVDYYFFIKKEKCIKTDEIKTAEIVLGSSFRVRGYRYSVMGFSYLIFRNADHKYLFKIIHCPETNEFFRQYLKP